jgi:hypothetical protein
MEGADLGISFSGCVVACGTVGFGTGGYEYWYGVAPEVGLL